MSFLGLDVFVAIIRGTSNVLGDQRGFIKTHFLLKERYSVRVSYCVVFVFTGKVFYIEFVPGGSRPARPAICLLFLLYIYSRAGQNAYPKQEMKLPLYQRAENNQTQ